MRYFRAITAHTMLLVCAARAVENPRPAPDLVINMGAGAKPVRLSELHGKTVVLAFILTYCSHCQAVIRGLIKDQQELGPKGLQVVACAIEDMAATAVAGFRSQFAPAFPVGYTNNSEAVKFLQHSPAKAFYMPALVFIDKSGAIRAQYEGRDPLLAEATQEKGVREKILEIMNAPGPAGSKKKPALSTKK